MVSTRRFVSACVVLGTMGAAVLPGCTMEIDDSDRSDGEVISEAESELLSAYILKAKHSGKCLDVEGGSTSNGTFVNQWQCHGGDNQRFNLVHLGGGYYSLIANHSGLCLDIIGGSKNAGTRLQQWQCHYQDNQKFNLIWHTDGSYSLVAKHSGLCVDVANASLNNGAQVTQWPCHWGTNQRFYLQ